MTTLISGGADGADKVFEMCAESCKHNIVVYKSGDTAVAEIPHYDAYLKYLNTKYINRMYPCRNEYVNGLLRRDAKIGMEADIVFVISTLNTDNNNSRINGGTAWASYTFIDKYCPIQRYPPGTIESLSIPFYLFEQNVCQWYQVSVKPSIQEIKFIPIDYQLKIPNGVKYAGIGTRELNSNGLDAIKSLF